MKHDVILKQDIRSCTDCIFCSKDGEWGSSCNITNKWLDENRSEFNSNDGIHPNCPLNITDQVLMLDSGTTILSNLTK